MSQLWLVSSVRAVVEIVGTAATYLVQPFHSVNGRWYRIINILKPITVTLLIIIDTPLGYEG